MRMIATLLQEQDDEMAGRRPPPFERGSMSRIDELQEGETPTELLLRSRERDDGGESQPLDGTRPLFDNVLV